MSDITRPWQELLDSANDPSKSSLVHQSALVGLLNGMEIELTGYAATKDSTRLNLLADDLHSIFISHDDKKVRLLALKGLRNIGVFMIFRDTDMTYKIGKDLRIAGSQEKNLSVKRSIFLAHRAMIEITFFASMKNWLRSLSKSYVNSYFEKKSIFESTL